MCLVLFVRIVQIQCTQTEMALELLPDVGDVYISGVVSDECIQIDFVLNEGWIDFIYRLQVCKGEEHMGLVLELDATQFEPVGELMV